MNDTTLQTEAPAKPKQKKVMHKHRVLHHPFVIFFKGTVLLLAYALAYELLPMAPNVEKLTTSMMAICFIMFGYMLHTKRGTIMRWRIRNTKYESDFETHDQLYRALLNKDKKYSSRNVRILRVTYGLTEAASMGFFGFGMGTFAVFLML